jgi:hypothetical protein
VPLPDSESFLNLKIIGYPSRKLASVVTLSGFGDGFGLRMLGIVGKEVVFLDQQGTSISGQRSGINRCLAR